MEPNYLKLLKDLLPFLAPIFIIQLGLAVYSLLDLNKRSRVHGPRWAWAVGLVISAIALPTGILLSAIYLVWGRNVEETV